MKSGNKEFRHYRFALNCSLLYSRSDSIELKRYGIIQVLPFQHTVTATNSLFLQRLKNESLEETFGGQVVRPPTQTSASFKFRPACSGSSPAKF